MERRFLLFVFLDEFEFEFGLVYLSFWLSFLPLDFEHDLNLLERCDFLDSGSLLLLMAIIYKMDMTLFF